MTNAEQELFQETVGILTAILVEDDVPLARSLMAGRGLEEMQDLAIAIASVCAGAMDGAAEKLGLDAAEFWNAWLQRVGIRAAED